ncbi:MAG: hypothetical protein RL885_09785 [Planctomycetota bacterium]
MNIRSPLLLGVLCALALAESARADHLEIHHLEGGTLGGMLMVHLHGDPGAPYLLVASPTTGPVTIQGFQLEVDLSWFPLTTSIPGMSGTFSPGGDAHVHVPLPLVAAWDTKKVFLQAIRLDAQNPSRIQRVSNAAHFTLGLYQSLQDTGATQFPHGLSGLSLIHQHHALIAGGGAGSWLSPIGSDRAEIWDPRTEAFHVTTSLNTARSLHTQTALGESLQYEALIAGGISSSQGVLSSAEVYQPSGSVFRTTGAMTTPRYGHTSAQLADGRVLIIGGASQFSGTVTGRASTAIASTEIWDPVGDDFTGAATMSEPRFGASAIRLSSGKVLVAGGLTLRNGTPTVSDTAELYDPGSGQFETPVSMGTARFGASLALLPDGNVLVAGGYTGDPNSPSATASTELFNIFSDSFAPTGSLNQARGFGSLVALPSGPIIAIGGATGSLVNPTPVGQVEQYLHSSGAWTTLSQPISHPRAFAGALDVGHGKVLVAGGLGINRIPQTAGELFFGK